MTWFANAEFCSGSANETPIAGALSRNLTAPLMTSVSYGGLRDEQRS